MSRSQKGLREGSQEKWGGSRENKVRDALPLCPFPHGFLRVLSKSLLVHALGSKKSQQECLMCVKNVKFNFGKLRPAVVWAISLSNFWISFEVYLGNSMAPQNKSFTISRYKQVLCRSHLLPCTVIYANFRGF